MPGGAVRADALRAAWTAASKEEGSLEPFGGIFHAQLISPVRIAPPAHRPHGCGWEPLRDGDSWEPLVPKVNDMWLRMDVANRNLSP